MVVRAHLKPSSQFADTNRMRAFIQTTLRWTRQLLIAVGVVALALLASVYVGGVESDAKADCIVVPGAAVWPNRQPSDALLYRLETALELYRDGRASTIIVTGGGTGNYAEGVVMGEWLTARGVPETCVIVENHSATTRDSGVHVARIMRQQGFESALVVSQWFHVARTRLCLAQEGVHTYASPSRGETLVDEPWFVFREMLALPAYACRADEIRNA